MLAWLFRERGEQLVDRMLEHAALSAVNLAEVLYRADEEGIPIDRLQRDLEALGVLVMPVSDEDAQLLVEVRLTARQKGLRLSLTDCCYLATGIRLGLPLVGGDQAWEWLRLAVEVLLLR